MFNSTLASVSRVLKVALLLVVSSAGLAKEPKLDIESLLEREWVQVRTQHVDFYSDLSVSEIRKAAEFAETFIAFSDAMMPAPINTDESKQIVIFIAGSEATAADLGMAERHSYVLVSGSKADYITLDANDGVGDHIGQSRSEQHMMFQAIATSRVYGMTALTLPTWYARGMAGYLSTFEQKGSRYVIGNIQAKLSRLYYMYKQRGGMENPDTETLLIKDRRPQLEEFPNQNAYLKAVHAHQSWSFFLVHYLHHDKALREGLKQYLALVSEGQSVEDALMQAFGYTFSDLDRELVRYSRSQIRGRAYKVARMQAHFMQENPDFGAEPEIIAVSSADVVRKYAGIVHRVSELPDEDIEAFQAAASQLTNEGSDSFIHSTQ